jgi:hypothetical protein
MAEMPANRICSKCKNAPATGKHPWCTPCQTAYSKENAAARERLARVAAFAAGCEAMRGALVRQLGRFGFTPIAAFEVKGFVQGFPRPEMPPD